MRLNMNSTAGVTGRALALILAAELGAASSVWAQAENTRRARDRAAERGNERGRLDRDRAMSDQQFIREAYERGLLELKLAHAAVEKTNDKQVETMAHRIINEQTRANEELKKLAEARNIMLPKDLSERELETVGRLSKHQGDAFERDYREHLKTEYKQTIQMFQNAARNARDEQVREVASRYATLFEQHAELIGIAGLGSNERGFVRERETAATAGTSAVRDDQFVKRAFRISRTQVEAARIGVKNSRDKQVQALAQRVISDHRQMNQDLRDLAAKKNINLPREINEAQDNIVENLSKATGKDFDKDYRQYMLGSHKNALELLQDGSKSNDPDIRAFADRYLNSVHEHMRTAQRLDTED